MRVKYLLLASVIPLLFACEKTPEASMNMGDQPDEETLNSAPVLTLHTPGSADGDVSVVVTRGEGFVSKSIYATSSRPAVLPQTIALEPDTTLAAAYRTKTGVDYKILPEAFYKFDESRILSLDENASTSSSTLLKIYATNPLGNELEEGEYLLPVVAKSSSQKVSTTLYYSVLVREPFTGDAKLYEGDVAFFIFDINTEQYDPRLVTDFYMVKSPIGSARYEMCGAVGNIVNLRRAMIVPDAETQDVSLSIGPDLRYVLNHADKYLLPVKETGRRVCISIEGAHTGIGFCNLTQSQISDFVEHVRQAVEKYNLDGVNLWDRNSDYGKEGMPAMNTTSYPKLIMALREALGPNKLLTLTDYEEPTEYFWDTDATGGIAVGNYIDYAWSGYDKESEGFQVVDPYHQDSPYVSKLHPRKPIAGLSPQKYACVKAPWIMPDNVIDSDMNVSQWVSEGLNSNKICVYADLRTNLQDEYEGRWSPSDLIFLYNISNTDTLYSCDFSQLLKFYGKWLKDW